MLLSPVAPPTQNTRKTRRGLYCHHHVANIAFHTALTLPVLFLLLFLVMAASFEPSLSTSGMRPPLASADAPSMADSLPSINFGFEDLRNRMAQFTAKFDAFIERGRKRVLEERNQFHINLAELQGRG